MRQNTQISKIYTLKTQSIQWIIEWTDYWKPISEGLEIYKYHQSYRIRMTTEMNRKLRILLYWNSFLSQRVLLFQFSYIIQLGFNTLVFFTRKVINKITFAGIIGRISLNLPGPTTSMVTWSFTTDHQIWRYRTPEK